MIQNDFDKVFMINLDSQSKRLENATENCNLYGVSFTRVSAVTGDEAGSVDNQTEGWNPNAKGLCLTTIDIIETAIKNKWKNVFIMEDDVSFVHNFAKLYSHLMKGIPDDWEFIHLNAQHKKGKAYYTPYVYRILSAWCCQAYGINHTVYEIYLEGLKKMDKPIDQVTAELHKRGNSYSPSIDIVYHIKNRFSTLREEVVKY